MICCLKAGKEESWCYNRITEAQAEVLAQVLYYLLSKCQALKYSSKKQKICGAGDLILL
jgi:hypothetical protein